MSVNLPTYVREKMPGAIVPVQYAEAVKALAECQTLDESKQWSDKADALAAWAKIYKHDEVGKQARQLKLHAYRRMGLIAEELRPTERGVGKRGASSLLKEHGLKPDAAARVMRIARAPQKDFDEAVAKGSGVYATAAKLRGLGKPGKPITSDAWSWLFRGYEGGPRLSDVRMRFRSRSARELASEMTVEEAENARPVITEIQEWLDELEQHLPKRPL